MEASGSSSEGEGSESETESELPGVEMEEGVLAQII